ncbi:MAG: 6-phosphogluconolactonase [Anaerolineae bacterium]|jgi:6-phosphogluconolactonase|nr:6-phosphogluconolactonase [Anaerolineae bacterium]MBT4312563.1 6-phosphogluconolactonase [Anaerolineae bacterium]MBT4457686.1 6-phosphogluconolactonase [Anaerolineae bacterium]MBT4841181.1 6-phosphogluconolactonase [Anaerolineae bacterium]MBT6062372.1 6-phosphogluconolactonase [Anaerolineae bacterium]
MNREVLISENSEALAKTFAEHFAKQALQAVEERGRFLAVLSGGGTPLKAYRLLAESPLRESVPWQDVHLFWGDERHISHDDLQSNFYQAREALLKHVNIPEENLHPVQTHLQPDKAAEAYEETLLSYAEASQNCVRFDLVLLGLGNDGHTASLFPSQSALWKNPVIVTEGSYQGRPATRITMTPLAFNQAREIVFLVSGAGKAEALTAALGEIRDVDRFPSQSIEPTDGSVLWMVDKDAREGEQ